MVVRLSKRDAVIAVDLQKDFCPGGSLAVAEAPRVIEVMNRWIDAAVDADAAVVLSRDWHPPGHCSFRQQGGPWPVHCLKGTAGAEFHDKVHVPDRAIIWNKAIHVDRECYSDFGEGHLAELLRDKGVERLWIGGLTTEYCVRATVLDARALGFETHVIVPGIRSVDVNEGDGDRAIEQMGDAGAILEGAASP